MEVGKYITLSWPKAMQNKDNRRPVRVIIPLSIFAMTSSSCLHTLYHKCSHFTISDELQHKTIGTFSERQSHVIISAFPCTGPKVIYNSPCSRPYQWQQPQIFNRISLKKIVVLEFFQLEGILVINLFWGCYSQQGEVRDICHPWQ
jgi:hypothetical protein